MNHLDAPQNPYQSFVVAASAGCGKTYQLSQRFLSLVASGAAPGSILTVTFTKKAAAEMRGRIVRDATGLLYDTAAAASFDHQLQLYYQEHRHRFQPPLNAIQVAEKVIGATQQLQICTIDSLFFNWTQRFAAEASPAGTPLPFMGQLLDASLARTISDDTWNKFCHGLHNYVVQHTHLAFAATWLREHGLLQFRHILEQLLRNETYLWLAGQVNGNTGFQEHHNTLVDADAAEDELSRLLRDLGSHLSANFAAKVNQVLMQGPAAISAWTEAGVLTGKLTVSKAYLRKPTPAVSSLVAAVESLAQQWENSQRRTTLNQLGEFFVNSALSYNDLRDAKKFSSGVIEFGDLSKAAFRLFNSPQAIGARYLLQTQISHLMIDEFQDTSKLQWSIFAELARDLTSDQDFQKKRIAIPRSCFFVGDSKQSIYGFREADPTILHNVAHDLAEQGIKQLYLNESYRSTATLMRVVNACFTGKIAGFPQHSAATAADGSLRNPDLGMVGVLPEVQARLLDNGTISDPVKDEASQVTQLLDHMLKHAADFPVYDRETKSLRPLRTSDCAILYRFSRHADAFEEALRARHLAVVRDSANGFFDRQEIYDVMALLRSAAYPDDLAAHYALAKSLWFMLGDADLSACVAAEPIVADAAPSRPQLLRNLLQQNNPSVAGMLSQAQSGALSPTALLLQTRQLLDVSGLQTLGFALVDSQQIIGNIDQFIEIALGLVRQGAHCYASLVQGLSNRADLDDLGNAQTGADAISMMTMHKAKGLEFPLSILVTTASVWEQQDRYWAKSPSNTAQLGMFYLGTADGQPINDPDFDALKSANMAELYQESMRLLYVGMTRAKQYLFVSGHRSPRQNQQEDRFHAYVAEAIRGLGAQVDDDFAGVGGLFLDYRKGNAVEPSATASDDVAGTVNLPMPRAMSTIRPALYTVRRPPLIHRSGASALPEIVHLTKDSGLANNDNLSPTWAAAYGTVVHALIEAYVAKKSCNLLRLRHRMSSTSSHLSTDEWTTMCADAEREVNALLSSNTWSELTADALSLRAEYAVAYARERCLVQARIDLWVEKADAIWLIDYKTATSMQHLPTYQQQLLGYKEVVSQLEREKGLTSRCRVTATTTYCEAAGRGNPLQVKYKGIPSSLRSWDTSDPRNLQFRDCD